MARPRLVKPVTFVVRCLGPGPEHDWETTDPIGLRTCPKCQAKIDRLGRCRVMHLYVGPTVNARVE